MEDADGFGDRPRPTQPPPVFDGTTKSLVEDAQSLVNQTQRVWDGIVARVQCPSAATFDNTVVPIIEDENAKSTCLRVLRFYASTHPSSELRKASNDATRVINNAEVGLYSRTDMFQLLDAILSRNKLKNGHDEAPKDTESRYFLEKLHRKFHRNGCGIATANERARFEESKKRLQDITRQCNKNMHEEDAGIWLTLDELEGVSQQVISSLRQGDDGRFWVMTKAVHSGPVLKTARRSETRRRMYYAVQNRMPANVPLFRELVLLRDETARRLGYANHAALQTADRMVRNPETVTMFLAEIRDRLVPCAQREADKIRQLKQADTGDADDRVFRWDQAYYTRQQLEHEVAMPGDILSEYFELQHTLQKLLDIFERMFGTRFQRVDAEQQRRLGRGSPLVWHDDVQMYTVWDHSKVDTETGTSPFMGYAYIDPFVREGKYSHVGVYQMQPGFIKPDGTRFYPSSALIVNYEKRSPNIPTLLTLEETRQLFHELGHLIHNLCTETKYADLCFVDRDFVEAPSIMFEQFMWNARFIQDVSFHYSHISPEYLEHWKARQQDPGTPLIPPRLDDDVASALARSNYTHNTYKALAILASALYDLAVHSPTSHEVLEQTDLTEMFNKMQTQVVGLAGGEALGDGWHWSHGQTFRPYINGYDAGYYSYILGKSHALDMFCTGFQKGPMSRAASMRFRDVVLRAGGSRPAMDILTDYLGREPSNEPYFRYLGVTDGA